MIKQVDVWKQDLCDPAIVYLENKYQGSEEISLGQLYLDIIDAGLSVYQVMFFAAFKDVPQDVRSLTRDTIINKIKTFLGVENIYEYSNLGPYFKLKCIGMAVEESDPCPEFFYISTLIRGSDLDIYRQNLEQLLGV